MSINKNIKKRKNHENKEVAQAGTIKSTIRPI